MDNHMNMTNNCPCRNNYARQMSSGNGNIPYRTKENYVVGMGYVPWQYWQNIYEPCKALSRGTIFAQLDKPFEGGCCR